MLTVRSDCPGLPHTGVPLFLTRQVPSTRGETLQPNRAQHPVPERSRRLTMRHGELQMRRFTGHSIKEVRTEHGHEGSHPIALPPIPLSRLRQSLDRHYGIGTRDDRRSVVACQPPAGLAPRFRKDQPVPRKYQVPCKDLVPYAGMESRT